MPRFDYNKPTQGIINHIPHKQLPTGTAGPVGASFAIVEKNWICPFCKHENFPTRNYCYGCRNKKPEEGGGLVMNTALVRDQAGESSAWRETIDPKSNLLYYYNTITGQTQWQRPAEMGPAPTGTGWYGRGAAGNELSELYEVQNEQFLQRPARQQAESIAATHTQRKEGAYEYNIWYGRYIGDQWEYGLEKGEPAPYRCHIAEDAGYTKADKVAAKGVKCYFCIHFARGCCARGSKCEYYHRIPIPSDMAKIDLYHDCFGRERFGKQRDDMGGIGSFESDSRTIYVAGLVRKDGQDLEEILNRHFSEFGEVEQINVIYRLSIAFVRYRLRCSAEFAKVAMANQALDGEEVLNIRWSYDDPNPIAKQAIARANKDAYLIGLKNLGISMDKTGFNYPTSYHPEMETGANSTQSLNVSNGENNASTILPQTDSQFETAKQQGFTVVDEEDEANNPYMPYIVPIIYPENVYEQSTDALEQSDITSTTYMNTNNDGLLNGSTYNYEEDIKKREQADQHRNELNDILNKIKEQKDNTINTTETIHSQNTKE